MTAVRTDPGVASWGLGSRSDPGVEAGVSIMLLKVEPKASQEPFEDARVEATEVSRETGLSRAMFTFRVVAGCCRLRGTGCEEKWRGWNGFKRK